MALVTLPATKAELEVALLSDEFIDNMLASVEKQASAVVGDLNTAKGRGVYISMAARVRSSKTFFDDTAKAVVAEQKSRPAMIDANRRKVRDFCDALAVKIRKGVTDWESEQERLKQEAAYAAMRQEAHEMDASITAERLVKKESDHEMALLMNDAFDRDAKAKADEVERLRKAHEEFIAQQAAEKAKREVEEKAKRDIEAAEQRERDAKLAQERAEQAIKDNAAKAERDAKELAERVEREKQDAIAAEKLKAQQEAERVQREAKQKEDARLAEEKRVTDEAAKRAADVEHRRTINRQAVADLIANGLPEDCAQKCVAAIAKNLISSVRITY
ncbi:TPA: cell envelope biogenesis protein TolA [Yersinia enterocolitica]|nr:cell envelope biogenesis protein TolA [Yersinia enterocolitica]